MAEKTVSKYLLNLEKQFANDNPILLNAAKIFHGLDQVEYDLGLIENDATTASKHSWWPIISLIGGNSTAKSRFINNYLTDDSAHAGIQAANHKFTILVNNNQTNPVTLPGTALDVDNRFPFYKISQRIEQLLPGEGLRINTYLELKTVFSERLKGKLFINVPNLNVTSGFPVLSMLTRHVIENSDLILVFCDVFETPAPLVDELVEQINLYQDTNKFIFLIDAPAANSFYPTNGSEIILSWRRRLADLGINTGQFILLPNQEHSLNIQNEAQFAEIDQRLTNVQHDRCYRILHALDRNIHDIENIFVPEVKQGIETWKERVNLSSMLILGSIAALLVFAELQIGIFDLLLDPVTGSIILLSIIAIMLPSHLILSKVQAKFIVNKLYERQKELNLMENLGEFFEKNLTFARMLFPISEPAGWNKKTKAKLAQLVDKTKDLVQDLNDSFSTYNDKGTH